LFSVELAGVLAEIKSVSDSIIVVKAASSAATIALSVQVIGSTGAKAVKSAAWTYVSLGAIVSVSPNSGEFGTYVSIVGSSLRGAGSSVVEVTLIGRLAEIISESDSLLVVRASNGPLIREFGEVRIVSNTGAFLISVIGSFSYTVPGVINSVQPSRAPGGAVITITGTLCVSVDTVISVKLAGYVANIIDYNCLESHLLTSLLVR
jgi:mucin-19